MSDIEVVALDVMGEMLSISSENWLFAKLNSDYKANFPNLLSRSRFNIRRRRLQIYINGVCLSLANQFSAKSEALIIDSIPILSARMPASCVPVFAKTMRWYNTYRGWHTAQQRYYYGFKLQLVITETGLPLASNLTPAFCHDTHALSYINETERTDTVLLADKGYLSAGLQATLLEELKIKLITPLRSNMKRKVSEWTPASLSYSL